MNILLIGSDSRGNTGRSARPPPERPCRTSAADVLMLVHVPADRQNVYVISLMRDLWVNIPGYGEAKINAGAGAGRHPAGGEDRGDPVRAPRSTTPS